MPRYVALVDSYAGEYAVHFPDAPGCSAAGPTVDEAIANAGEALAGWVADELADGRSAPSPRSVQELRQLDSVAQAVARSAMISLVPLVRSSGRLTKANISLDSGLLLAIDEAADRAGMTRSKFMASAVREKIEAGA